MLAVMRRGRPDEREALAEEEDRALRRAFGRFSRGAWREAGLHIVRRRQPERGGQWFACDCLGDVPCPPVLVPVAEAFVRRHVEGPWPEHDDWCDFYKEPAEQGEISASYSRPPRSGRFRLVRPFRKGESEYPGVHPASGGRRRPGLARLLLGMLDEAGLTHVGQAVASAAEQYAALRAVAREMRLEADLPLDRYFLSYPPALPEFRERVAAATPARFKVTRRPHGVLVGVAASLDAGVVTPLTGEPFRVAGAISVFGESDGHAARTARGVRPPYVFAAVVGRREPDSPVEVLRAYLHPCVTPTWLLPVDSDP